MKKLKVKSSNFKANGKVVIIKMIRSSKIPREISL